MKTFTMTTFYKDNISHGCRKLSKTGGLFKLSEHIPMKLQLKLGGSSPLFLLLFKEEKMGELTLNLCSWSGDKCGVWNILYIHPCYTQALHVVYFSYYAVVILHWVCYVLEHLVQIQSLHPQILSFWLTLNSPLTLAWNHLRGDTLNY